MKSFFVYFGTKDRQRKTVCSLDIKYVKSFYKGLHVLPIPFLYAKVYIHTDGELYEFFRSERAMSNRIRNIRRLGVYQGRRFTAYIYQKNSGLKRVSKII